MISNKKVSGCSYTKFSKYYTKYSKYSTNTQESSKNNGKGILVDVINPYHLTGFIDGEGCFSISLYKNSELAVGWQIIPIFKISLHVKDKALLELIQRSLGVGTIYKHEAVKIP